jgi:hypothetical protein
MAAQEAPITYGDLRLKADRQHGPCLFWVGSTAALLACLRHPPPGFRLTTLAQRRLFLMWHPASTFQASMSQPSARRSYTCKRLRRAPGMPCRPRPRRPRPADGDSLARLSMRLSTSRVLRMTALTSDQRPVVFLRRGSTQLSNVPTPRQHATFLAAVATTQRVSPAPAGPPDPRQWSGPLPTMRAARTPAQHTREEV